MMHDLKCWPEFFAPLAALEKTFEIRKNDRGFKVGDLLKLREWNPQTQTYSGAWCIRSVKFVTDFPAGLREGYVCMSLGAGLEDA